MVVAKEQDGTSGRSFTLDDLESADVVTFKGERYRLARSTAFSIRQEAHLRRLLKRMGALEEIDDPSEDDLREYRKLAVELAGLALPDAPAAVLGALTDENLKELIVIFFGRSANPEASPVARTLKRLGFIRTSSTSSASADSSVSTVAT